MVGNFIFKDIPNMGEFISLPAFFFFIILFAYLLFFGHITGHEGS